jgi:hypothetical protein
VQELRGDAVKADAKARGFLAGLREGKGV